MASPSRLARTAGLKSNLPFPDLQCTPGLRRWLSPRTPTRKVSSENQGNRSGGHGCVSPFSVDTPERRNLLETGSPLETRRSVLGVGAYGTVYKACYKGRQVAAKLVRRRAYTETAIEAEERAAFLQHSNVVKIFTIQKGSALSLIAMELCGTSLQDRLEEAELPGGERLDILVGVSRALQFCHRIGIVHADVKPKNVLIGFDGQPKLTDFGSSVLIGEPSTANGICGTPGYAAPEILKGNPATPAADVYSLGILAWQMLSRKLPFEGLHVHTIIYLSAKGARPEDGETLPDGLNGRYKLLYRSMWAQTPSNRPQIEWVIDRANELIENRNWRDATLG